MPQAFVSGRVRLVPAVNTSILGAPGEGSPAPSSIRYTAFGRALHETSDPLAMVAPAAGLDRVGAACKSIDTGLSPSARPQRSLLSTASSWVAAAATHSWAL